MSERLKGVVLMIILKVEIKPLVVWYFGIEL